jgi:hypothetical protein
LIYTVINIPNGDLIADGNLETQERVVENNNTFIKNNAEICVTNDRSSAEITDSFFTVLNRVADLLNNPLPAKPSSLPIPIEQESSTLEAVNHPVSFTPYIDFQNVVNQLEEQNIGSSEAEDNIADNLDILLEESRNFFSWIPAQQQFTQRYNRSTTNAPILREWNCGSHAQISKHQSNRSNVSIISSRRARL